MIAWLRNFWEALTWTQITLAALVIIVSVALSFAMVSLVMVRIPATYFHPDHNHTFMAEKHPFLRLGGMVGKNVLGVLLIVVGIIMALPGVPGPGFLTFFIGLILTDIPGKRSVEARIIRRPSVLGPVNRLRAKYDKPPLLLE